DENGMHLKIWGAPAFQTAERTVLFLAPRADGSYGPLHLALGAFHEMQAASGQKVAVRDLQDMTDVTTGGAKQAQDSVRDSGRFAAWLADRAAGLKRTADYFVALPASDLRSIHEKFTYLSGEKQRWSQFDSGTAVGWRSQDSGQPGLDDGGVSEFQAALAAWDNDPNTNIKYRYDGTTSATAGFQHSDGINAIIYNDPNNEVDGTFTCSTPGRGSGVLAIGGTWSSPTASGISRINEGDIVTNDGVGCWFISPKRAEQIFGHELGHTLGLGHSCGDGESGDCVSGSLQDDALMRATAHLDERGARLNDDDRAGILTLYPGADVPPPSSAPAAPTNLVATPASTTSIQLTWTDNATNETTYRVEMKTTAKYAVVKTLGANVTSVTITGLTAGTSYTFRVQARNTLASPYSNEASAATPSAAQPPAAPSNLTAVQISNPDPNAGQNFMIRLDWQNNSNNETGFVIDMNWPDRAANVTITIPVDGQTNTFVVDGRTPNVPYTFRIRAVNAAGGSAYSNEASATAVDLPAGPCVAGAQKLCLQANRFVVSVRWRTSTATGAGTAVPQSDQTGLFWFFDASNIELIVKMIDGRGLNGFFWTYYGGLSDQEYWITVADTQTGASRTYHNDPGSLCGLGDVNAFAGSASPSTAPAPASLIATAPDGTCAPGALCLFGGRFQATVHWTAPGFGSGSGAGTPLPLTDVSGMFWFFDAANIELVVKVIDARTVNGKFWVFYGALSDVQYDLTVTDTATGLSHTYHNNQGNLCGQGDTSTFSG
ncbi:MAG TPA: fibronectin type III domain-containing protein, partial [Thermoanaerobaculia bacterium]|nr:fibronectin type III domain-containing protein [Thermoanaerobaculia bacterium]